ncbi:LysE family translocator [Photobacterium ganghwense]|uniref:LysE family translocator n=1 Tax=Photobacterium ganghwense TaxID=320778 RepID=UPI001C2DBC7F|nr:LysE family translocator [Photobacterium ganghwense]MBV1842140.1 LysE family translocator [Photobacterium ganghwense]
MDGITELGLFIITAFALNITPGPDSLYIIGRSAHQGWRAGTVAALGIASGVMVHVLAAALGLSALLATSATAFTVVKVIGCLYLLYIGVGMLRARHASPELPLNDGSACMPLNAIYFQGFLTNTLNPKVALFFLAFVPQFIAPDATEKAWSFILLGVIFNVNSLLWSLFLVWASSRLGARLRHNPAFTVWLNKLAGGLFVYFGCKLALSQNT